MRVGILHNAYRFRGGEERVAEAESGILLDAGFHVARLTFDNRQVFADLGSTLGAMVKSSAGWNRHAAHRIADWVRDETLDIVHVHNIYPFITAAGIDAVRRLRVPVVMTLHNFRPICAAGTMTRDGRHCEDCLGTGPGPAVRHGCYRGSKAQSVVWAGAHARARANGIWNDAVDLYIAPSSHVRDAYVRGGFPSDRIIVRPHFTDLAPCDSKVRSGAVLVGRVEESKGVLELLRRWPAAAPALTIVGDGPDLERARLIAGPNVVFTGPLSRLGVSQAMASASVLVSASQLPETFGLTLIEAGVNRTPSVAFACGGSISIIQDGVTGALVRPGDFTGLISRCLGYIEDDSMRTAHGDAAFARYHRDFSPRAGLESLVSCYRRAMRVRSGAVA